MSAAIDNKTALDHLREAINSLSDHEIDLVGHDDRFKVRFERKRSVITAEIMVTDDAVHFLMYPDGRLAHNFMDHALLAVNDINRRLDMGAFIIDTEEYRLCYSNSIDLRSTAINSELFRDIIVRMVRELDQKMTILSYTLRNAESQDRRIGTIYSPVIKEINKGNGIGEKYESLRKMEECFRSCAEKNRTDNHGLCMDIERIFEECNSPDYLKMVQTHLIFSALNDRLSVDEETHFCMFYFACICYERLRLPDQLRWLLSTFVAGDDRREWQFSFENNPLLW